MAGRLTMGNLIRDLQPRVDVEAEGVSVSGQVGPASVRVSKRKGARLSGELVLPAGEGQVMVGRGEDGRFTGRMTQRVKGVDVEAAYDDRGPGMRVSKTMNVRWK